MTLIVEDLIVAGVVVLSVTYLWIMRRILSAAERTERRIWPKETRAPKEEQEAEEKTHALRPKHAH